MTKRMKPDSVLGLVANMRYTARMDAPPIIRTNTGGVIPTATGLELLQEIDAIDKAIDTLNDTREGLVRAIRDGGLVNHQLWLRNHLQHPLRDIDRKSAEAQLEKVEAGDIPGREGYVDGC